MSGERTGGRRKVEHNHRGRPHELWCSGQSATGAEARRCHAAGGAKRGRAEVRLDLSAVGLKGGGLKAEGLKGGGLKGDANTMPGGTRSK